MQTAPHRSRTASEPVTKLSFAEKGNHSMFCNSCNTTWIIIVLIIILLLGNGGWGCGCGSTGCDSGSGCGCGCN